MVTICYSFVPQRSVQNVLATRQNIYHTHVHCQSLLEILCSNKLLASDDDHCRRAEIPDKTAPGPKISNYIFIRKPGNGLFRKIGALYSPLSNSIGIKPQTVNNTKSFFYLIPDCAWQVIRASTRFSGCTTNGSILFIATEAF